MSTGTFNEADQVQIWWAANKRERHASTGKCSLLITIGYPKSVLYMCSHCLSGNRDVQFTGRLTLGSIKILPIFQCHLCIRPIGDPYVVSAVVCCSSEYKTLNTHLNTITNNFSGFPMNIYIDVCVFLNSFWFSGIIWGVGKKSLPHTKCVCSVTLNHISLKISTSWESLLLHINTSR